MTEREKIADSPPFDDVQRLVLLEFITSLQKAFESIAGGTKKDDPLTSEFATNCAHTCALVIARTEAVWDQKWLNRRSLTFPDRPDAS